VAAVATSCPSLDLAGDVTHDAGHLPDRAVEILSLIVKTVPDQEKRDGADDDYVTHVQRYRIRPATATAFPQSPTVLSPALAGPRSAFRAVPKVPVRSSPDTPPDKSCVRLREARAGEPLLSAMPAEAKWPLGTAVLIACLLKFPLMTWKINVGIYWQRRYSDLRGARFRLEPVRYRRREAGGGVLAWRMNVMDGGRKFMPAPRKPKGMEWLTKKTMALHRAMP
jgi:hypothetical protein